VSHIRRSDLDPPLGKPGGPCHVVRRIEQGVGSPHVRERLVTKVVEGLPLSNPEAAAVYDLDLEKTRGLVTRLLVGPHTQYRMDLRGVTVRNLKDAVEELGRAYHAARKSGDERSLEPFQAFLEGGKLDYVTSQGLQVVLAAEKGGARVVTTYWKGWPDPRPSGHCDPVAARVARRYARRTIQFDTRAVSLLGSELAEQAIDHVLRTVPADTGIEWELDRNEILARGKLELPDVRGRTKQVDVLVGHRSMPNDKPTAGGFFRPDSDTVQLFLNSRWTPAALQSKRLEVQSTFSTFLVHEMTHALDVLPSGQYEGAEGDSATYYNQPAEFRAFSKQVVTDVLSRWRMTLRRNPRKSGAALVEASLEASPNYQKVKGYFSKGNHQRLRQMVVRELEQAGLLTT
jgi:hypothetical protein